VFNAYANGTLNDKSVDQIVFDALFYDKLTDTPGALTEFFTPFVSESLGSEAVFDIAFRNGETRDGRTIYFDQDGALERIDKSLGHLFSQLEPGASRSVRRVYKGITGTFTQFGQQLDASTELAAFKEYILDSFDAQKVFYQVLEDMETMGVSSRKLEEILENRLRNKSEVEQLIDGEFKVPGFSEETFEDQIDRLRIEDPVQAAKISFEINQAIRSMNNVRDRLDIFDLDNSRDELDSKINEILFPTISLSRILEDAPTATVVEPKAELPTDQRAAIQPSGNVIAQTIKQPSLTELAKGNLGNQFNLFRTI
jgi:hypothetical protein